MPPILRASTLLTAFFVFTLPLMPVQALLLRVGARGDRPPWRHFPNWYHRRLCRLLGVRLHIEGRIEPGTPTLILANHVSWLDIPVLSAMAPVSFVAKSEVGTWPMVRTLARLQRTIFVDRTRRMTVGQTASEIERRLAIGDAVVLFAEGTSNDGNQVLPFRSALIAAAGIDARRGTRSSGDENADQRPARAVEVRTLAIAYTHRNGLPLDRFARPEIAWYGDMELGGHVWTLLKRGALDVSITIGPPVPLEAFADRKALARQAEADVRSNVTGLLRQAGHGAR